jgi:hypothetical protein
MIASRAMLLMGALLAFLPASLRAEEPPAIGDKRIAEGKPTEEGKRIEILVDVPGSVAPVKLAAMKAEIERLEAELRLKQAELHQLEARLLQARERAQQKGPAKAEGKLLLTTPDGEKRVVILGDGVLQLKPADAPKAGTAPKGKLYELVEGEKGTLILRPVAPPSPEPVRVRIGDDRGNPKVLVRPALPPGQPGGWQIERPGDADKRTEALAKRLDELARELEQLRKELKTPRPPAPKLEIKPGTRPEEDQDEIRKRDDAKRAEVERALERARREANGPPRQ